MNHHDDADILERHELGQQAPRLGGIAEHHAGALTDAETGAQALGGLGVSSRPLDPLEPLGAGVMPPQDVDA